MSFYSTLADDYFVNLNLNTEMPPPTGRETVLDFYGRIQKGFPEMRNFYTRENGDFVLEEDKDRPSYRWMSLEPRRLCSGGINPESVETAMSQHELALEIAPYMLSVRTLDCEALDFMMGFDFNYRGNHDALVAETLGLGHSLEGLLDESGGQTLNFEPSLTLALDDECRRQARLMIETRTSAYQVRRNDYPEESISVYFTVRQYGSLPHDGSFVDTFRELRETCETLLDRHVIGSVLQPLQQAIAAR